MKKLLPLLICLATFATSFAQTLHTVSGSVQDQQAASLPFTNVLLLKGIDSTLVKGTLTDQNGHFVLDQVPDNEYVLVVSMIGYKKFTSSKFSLNRTNHAMKWPTIQLQLATTELQGITVTAQKPFIEQQIDKTVLNVENSLVASGSTALEVLEKAPGVHIDHQNEQIKLNNKTGVMVMIDGKKSILSNTDLTTMLRNMSSDQIATIELITNPSSKYDASGNAGIINIRLKKNTALGTNGTISSTLSNGFMPDAPNDLWRTFMNLSLNHRTQKWNFYGNVGSFRKADYNQLHLQRNVTYEGLTSTFDQRFSTLKHSNGLSGKLGADYFLSPKTTLGMMLDGTMWKSNSDVLSKTFIHEVQTDEATTNSFIQKTTIRVPFHTLTANFNVKHEFNKKGTELTFDADYYGFNNAVHQQFETDFMDQEGNLKKQTSLLNKTLTNIDIYASKVDFTIPLAAGIKLESGLKTSYVVTNHTFGFYQLVENAWQNDSTKSNQFIYKENINAGYVNFSKQWKKWALQAGVRAEHTYAHGNSVTAGEVFQRNYLSIFPTLFLNQTLDKNNSLRYSYSRRIDRPGYRQLNPFKFYMDPFTIDEGNPFLKPQFTDNFELTYTYKSASSLSLGYSNTHDYLVQLTEQDDSSKIVKAINGNLGQFKNYSANLSFPIPVRNWWVIQNKVSIYYQVYSDSDLLGGKFRTGQLAYTLNTSSSFTLPKNWALELNVFYNSPYSFGTERSIRPQYAVNMGIQKSFDNKKWKVKLNVNDLFFTSTYTGEVKYQNIDLAIRNQWTSRRVSLTCSYSLGNQTMKAYNRKGTATEDLKKRAGGEN